MPLTDATNAAAVAPRADAAALKAKLMSSGGGTSKLCIALDALAGFEASARDDATAKLDTAAAKDVSGLCVALLGVASDKACAPTRRLAAATFARNCLRKRWGGSSRGDELEAGTETGGVGGITQPARCEVRTAALKALVVAPVDTRRLLADCLRLAAHDAVAMRPSDINETETAFAKTDRFASAARLIEDVIAFATSDASPGALFNQPGLLLATYVASAPFQYFRDPTVAIENAHPCAERLCAALIVPRLVKELEELAGATGDPSRDTSHTLRVAFKILFRLTRAHMPCALANELPQIVRSVENVCASCVFSKNVLSPESWIAVKRGLKLGASLLTRHADVLDAVSVTKLVHAAKSIASIAPGSNTPPPQVTAAAFALLRAALDRRSTRDALVPDLVGAKDDKARESSRRVLLALFVRDCVLPHVSLTAEDREGLFNDPEEYARANACGEARCDGDSMEECLDGGDAGGVTARNAALDFLEHLAVVSFESTEAVKQKPAKKQKKEKKITQEGDEVDEDNENSKPTLGELAARDVMDVLLSKAPKGKVEKVGKAAAASGVTIAHVAPMAEAALGESAYFGLLRVMGALTSASHKAKESATRQFLRKHAFPAVAAAASPHVVVAAACHLAAVSTKITTPVVAREAFSALVAALERPTPEAIDAEDEDKVEEAWRVTRDAASWAARAVCAEAPCADEAFGVASSEATVCLAERLVALAEKNPAKGAAPLRALAGLAEAATSAIATVTAAVLAARIVHAYAEVCPNGNEGDGCDDDGDDETGIDAWETSVEAVASLCECAENCEGNDEATVTKTAAAKTKLAAIAAAHVRAYWKAAAAMEPPCFSVGDDDDDGTDMHDANETDTPPAHPATAPMLRFACQTLAEASTSGAAVDAATASKVFAAAGDWASFLPAWQRREGDEICDDDALDALTCMLGACVESNAGELVTAALAVPGAAAAAATLAETEDSETRCAAARAVAAAVSSCASVATPDVVTAARDAADCAVSPRDSRAALHLLVAVAWAAPSAVAIDPAGWMRAVGDAASASGWNPSDSDDQPLLAAHLDACVCMLRAATKKGASAPDKRLFASTLEEAMKGVNELVDDEEAGTEAEEEDGEDDESDGSESDESDDENADVAHETENEFLERYAAIAQGMADGGGGDGDDGDADENLEETDEAFSAAFAPTKGDGKKSAKRFSEWYRKWKTDGSSGLRTATLVDPVIAKRFEKIFAKTLGA